jgi:hypothetical protein
MTTTYYSDQAYVGIFNTLPLIKIDEKSGEYFIKKHFPHFFTEIKKYNIDVKNKSFIVKSNDDLKCDVKNQTIPFIINNISCNSTIKTLGNDVVNVYIVAQDLYMNGVLIKEIITLSDSMLFVLE